ncbi:helix-turn-helix transcriptional regulator, partial [Megamonas sp.]
MLDFFRQEKNMTMEELGAYLGRNKSTVSRWISGERYP